MNVQVQFFSRLRDLTGESELELDIPERTRVTELLGILYERTPALCAWDKSILIAAGLEFVDRNYVLKKNDRISIMPPVQGG